MQQNILAGIKKFHLSFALLPEATGSRMVKRIACRRTSNYRHGLIASPIGNGLWEIRTNLPTKRTARLFFCLYDESLVALHGFIKKTRTLPDDDLTLALKRKKELEQ
jgi:phage-related protein